MLIAGFIYKGQCLTDTGWGRDELKYLCYNDIQALYVRRGIDTHTFPYIWGFVSGGEIKGGGIEYPVLTGLFMWASGYLAGDMNDYLVVSALLLAPFALFIAWLLYRMSGARAFYWALAPSLIIYSFHNWDLLVVAAAVTGLYQWWKGRHWAAALAFGIGGAFKLYPLMFLVPLFLDRWVAGEETSARRTFGIGIGTVIAINLPIAYVNPPSWWITYEFHSLRPPNPDSLWGRTFPDLDPSVINKVSLLLTAIGCAAVLWWCYRRAKEEGAFPFLQSCAALLSVFLLFNKVQSPQFMLWLLPFMVVVNVKRGWWVAFVIIDFVAFVSVFRWFFDTRYEPGAELAYYVMIVSVFARAALWAALTWVFVRSEPAVGSVAGKSSSRIVNATPKGTGVPELG